MPKHRLFNSKYLQDFAVVEQWEGNVSKFPHSDQLPKLWRALNLEFNDGVPNKIARVDHRAKDHMKFYRHHAVLAFCLLINRERPDNVRIVPLVDRNLVSQLAIVQQIVTHADQGLLHKFKFYGGPDFFTEVHLNDRRLCFSGHFLDRFSERAPNYIGADLTNFLSVILSSPTVLMECNNTSAFAYLHEASVLSFPVRESDTEKEYFFPTCLSSAEINTFTAVMPPPAFTPHYDPHYTMPTVRNWNHLVLSAMCYQTWKDKIAPTPEIEFEKMVSETLKSASWAGIGHSIIDRLKEQGHGEGSRLAFKDNIPGSSVIYMRPGQPEPRHVELDDLKKMSPGKDWESIVAEMKAHNPQWYGSAGAV